MRFSSRRCNFLEARCETRTDSLADRIIRLQRRAGYWSGREADLFTTAGRSDRCERRPTGFVRVGE